MVPEEPGWGPRTAIPIVAQAYLGDIADLVPDHGNKASIAIK